MIRLTLLAGLLLLASCAHQPPKIAAHPECGTGWDDCAWQEGLSVA